MTELASSGQLRAAFLRWALVCVPAVLLLGFMSMALSGEGAQGAWFDGLVKPVLFPPPATFGIVWSVIYIMMGLSLAMIITAWGAAGRGLAFFVFAVQLILNLAWSPVFFGAHQMSWALWLLVAMDVAVAITLVLFARVRRRAAMLLLPYLLWILFATVLNWQFLEQNNDADGVVEPEAVVRIQL